MKEKWKNIGVIAGHVIAAIVVMGFIFTSDYLLRKYESVETTALGSLVTQTPTLTPTDTPALEPVNTPTPITTPIPTNTPTPTMAPEETLTPTPTPTMALEETLTPTPTPTMALEETLTPTPEPTPTEVREQVKQQVRNNIENGVYAAIDNSSDNGWWFTRKKNHVPSGTGEYFDIEEYSGYYLNEYVAEGDKVIYLTIDCGYGSANTPVMLDIFKKHDIKVTFFVTEYFIKANPQYVVRMLEEGHMVGNHTCSHPNLTAKSDQEIYDELIGVEEAFYEATGQQINMFFRAPEGRYSRRVLQIVEDLGYKTMFWSMAYADYDKNNQKSVEWILEHFDTYHHNGALILLHNDSNGNRDAMDQLLTMLKEEGYRFGTLNEFGTSE